MPDVEEERTCKVTDGLYEKSHPACKECCEKAKKVCRIFAVWNGLLDKQELIDRQAKDET